jgi:hypothetical protein
MEIIPIENLRFVIRYRLSITRFNLLFLYQIYSRYMEINFRMGTIDITSLFGPSEFQVCWRSLYVRSLKTQLRKMPAVSHPAEAESKRFYPHVSSQ